MEQKETVVDHFDRFAEGDRWSKLYDQDADPHGTYNFRVRRDRVEELSAGVGEGHRVLDIGCGTAIMAPFYLERGCEYHGSDIAEQMVEQACRRVAHERASFSVGDVEAGLDFPDGHFDLVVGLGLLEYLGDVPAAAAEMVRLTRPGGSLIVSVPQSRCFNHVAKTLLSPLITNAWAAVKRLRGRATEPHGVYHRRFSAGELEGLFARQGCTKTGEAYYNLEVLFYPLHRLLPGLAYRVKQRAEGLRGTWMHVFATGYIIRCRRAAE
ncbi:MAG: class I SAM-dependent methyltransferase [Candidatus Brocadiia bacterium]